MGHGVSYPIIGGLVITPFPSKDSNPVTPSEDCLIYSKHFLKLYIYLMVESANVRNEEPQGYFEGMESQTLREK